MKKENRKGKAKKGHRQGIRGREGEREEDEDQNKVRRRKKEKWWDERENKEQREREREILIKQESGMFLEEGRKSEKGTGGSRRWWD